MWLDGGSPPPHLCSDAVAPAPRPRATPPGAPTLRTPPVLGHRRLRVASAPRRWDGAHPGAALWRPVLGDRGGRGSPHGRTAHALAHDLFQWHYLCYGGLWGLSASPPRPPAGVDRRGGGRLYDGVFCGGPGQSPPAVRPALRGQSRRPCPGRMTHDVPHPAGAGGRGRSQSSQGAPWCGRLTAAVAVSRGSGPAPVPPAAPAPAG